MKGLLTTSALLVSACVCAQVPPGGGGGSPSDWQVMPTERLGTYYYENWEYGSMGEAVKVTSAIPWGYEPVPGNAYYATHYSVAPKMRSSGTIKLKLKWVGEGSAPLSVWMKVYSSAENSSNEMEFQGQVLGVVSNGIGDPPLPTPDGGHISSGAEYYKVTVEDVFGEFLATKTITLFAEGYYAAPYASVTASCGASLIAPDDLTYEGRKMEFTNVLGDIIDQVNWFGVTTGSPYPVRGWYKPGQTATAYPVHFKKASPLNVTFEHRVAVDWLEPTPPVVYQIDGIMGAPGVFFSWPSLSGTASEDFVSKSFVSTQTLFNKIYKFEYGPDWTVKPDEPFAIRSLYTGANTVFVTWDAPKGGEVVTYKRLNWAVTAADGATTLEQAADKIQAALAGDPPIEPSYAYQNNPNSPYHNHNLPDCEYPKSVWRLLDGTNYGECDEQARLMKAGLNLLGVNATADFVFASSDTNVEDLEITQIGGFDAYLFMDFLPSEPLPGDPDRWNQYEGVCRVPFSEGQEGVYAVWPQAKADSMLQMLQTLAPGQYWIYLTGTPKPNEQTGALPSGWRFAGIADLNPVPIPGG